LTAVQTEDGLLLCWKVDENEIIRVVGQGVVGFGERS
jgi:hypothetical protein